MQYADMSNMTTTKWYKFLWNLNIIKLNILFKSYVINGYLQATNDQLYSRVVIPQKFCVWCVVIVRRIGFRQIVRRIGFMQFGVVRRVN